jgi:hypothetical protein
MFPYLETSLPALFAEIFRNQTLSSGIMHDFFVMTFNNIYKQYFKLLG